MHKITEFYNFDLEPVGLEVWQMLGTQARTNSTQRRKKRLKVDGAMNIQSYGPCFGGIWVLLEGCWVVLQGTVLKRFHLAATAGSCRSKHKLTESKQGIHIISISCTASATPDLSFTFPQINITWEPIEGPV